jgi:hypothetical protein
MVSNVSKSWFQMLVLLFLSFVGQTEMKEPQPQGGIQRLYYTERTNSLI